MNLARADQVQRAVRRDAIDPRAERRAAVEAIDLLPGAQEGLLHHVLGVLFIASHTKSETEDGPAVALHKHTKGLSVALACLFGRGTVGPFHPAAL